MAGSVRRGNPNIVAVVAVAAIVALLSVRFSGEALGARFLDALRIAKPKPVTASAAVATTSAGRDLRGVVMGILAETTTVATDEPDVAEPSPDAARRGGGIPVRLLSARSDAPSISVTGAHTLSVRVKREQLRTLLAQAGRPAVNLPESVDGASVQVQVGRGVRVQYGNCPTPVANTLQNQIQGPPPPSTDNANCVVLTETPLASVTTPALLDTAAVLEIALELIGMSPNQARDFRLLFDWRSAMTLSPPRSVRSYEIVNVGSTRGMLVITGGRRGPTYALAWVQNGVVSMLTGYGSSADAVPLARSAR